MPKEFLEAITEAEQMLSARTQVAEGQVKNLVPRVAKLLEVLKGDKYLPHQRRYLIEEAATTSDFPLLFGNVLDRLMVAAYKVLEPDIFQYIGRTTFSDFRNKEFNSAHGGEGALDVVRQRGEYKGTSISEGQVTAAPEKYGRAYPYSWETLINDVNDTNALAPQQRFARAARRTVWKQATGLIAEAAGPHSGLYGAPVTHPLDGLSITNQDANALTPDNLGVALMAMTSQTDFDGEPVIFEKLHLVVPPKGEMKAMEVLESESLVLAGTAGAVTIRGNRNVIARKGIMPHINPYLPILNTTNGDDTWYLFADPVSDGPAAVFGFLTGRENPEIVFKASDKQLPGGGLVSPLEGDFWHDTIWVRVRHIMNGARLDPRRTSAHTGGF